MNVQLSPSEYRALSWLAMPLASWNYHSPEVTEA